ncbi:unnamed protein product [Rotaria sp. Silwood2]|nr:unnamed protein product [Rotaria sp. Silwood2]
MWSYISHCFLLLFLCNHVTNTRQIPFDTIVPPYFEGRFSNGPVWIEKLGVSNIKNYAYGGAATDNDFIQGYTASDTIPVPGVRQQIKIYFNQTNITTVNSMLNTNLE